MFSECSCEHQCMHEFRTNIVSKISWVFVHGIWLNFYHWWTLGKDECVRFWGQRSRVKLVQISGHYGCNFVVFCIIMLVLVTVKFSVYLSVHSSVLVACPGTNPSSGDRDFGFSPYGSLESLVFCDKISCHEGLLEWGEEGGAPHLKTLFYRYCLV